MNGTATRGPRIRRASVPAGTRLRRIGGHNVTVTRTGLGQDSIVHVTGLAPLSQDDARWLLNELAKVTLMPPRNPS